MEGEHIFGKEEGVFIVTYGGGDILCISREQEHYDQIVRYVKSLSKEELRAALINALIEAKERDRYR